MYMSKLVSGIVTTMAETPENSDEEWEDEARRLMEKRRRSEVYAEVRGLSVRFLKKLFVKINIIFD